MGFEEENIPVGVPVMGQPVEGVPVQGFPVGEAVPVQGFPVGEAAACAAGPPLSEWEVIDCKGMSVGMCWVLMVGSNAVLLGSPPMHMLTFVRNEFGALKKETKDGNTYKITWKEGFKHGIDTAKCLFLIMSEFIRTGYRLKATIRCPYAASDQIVLECADKLAASEPGPPPQMWSIRMNSTDVWTINAPQDICEDLTACLARTDCNVSDEKCDGIVKQYSAKSSLSMMTLINRVWAAPGHKAMALLKMTEIALDKGWRIVDSIAVGRTLDNVDSLTFAHESTPNLNPITAPEKRTKDGVVGVVLVLREAEQDVLILNALTSLEHHIGAFLENVWGGRMWGKTPSEPYARVEWRVDDGQLDTGKKLTKQTFKTRNLMFELFLHIRKQGYEFIGKVRTGPMFNMCMFRYCPELVRTEPVEYFGVMRHWVDSIGILRQSEGWNETVVSKAILHSAERSWPPGVKFSSPASKNGLASLTVRGCPWLGRETSLVKAAFNGISPACLNFKFDLLISILNTGAELCAEISCIGIGACQLWIFKMPIAQEAAAAAAPTHGGAAFADVVKMC